jgi:hypothetical protein
MKRQLTAAPRMALRTLGLSVFLLASVLNAGAQTTPTPEMEQARAETAVVYDLGRFFGYVHGMTTENRSLTLTPEQKREILSVMEEIRGMARIEPAWAESTLEYLELDLLSPAQLMDVDQRAIAREQERESTGVTGGGGGTGGGTGPLSSYAAGGPFNPLLDDTKTIGQGFAELYDYLK